MYVLIGTKVTNPTLQKSIKKERARRLPPERSEEYTFPTVKISCDKYKNIPLSRFLFYYFQNSDEIENKYAGSSALATAKKGHQHLMDMVSTALDSYLVEPSTANESQAKLFVGTWPNAENVVNAIAPWFTMIILYLMHRNYDSIGISFVDAFNTDVLPHLNVNHKLFSDHGDILTEPATDYRRRKSKPLMNLFRQIYDLLDCLFEALSNILTNFPVPHDEKMVTKIEQQYGGFSEIIYAYNKYTKKYLEDKYLKSTLITLANPTGVCFMNVIIYVLFYYEPFRNEVLALSGDATDNEDMAIMLEFKTLFQHLREKVNACNAVPYLAKFIAKTNISLTGGVTDGLFVNIINIANRTGLVSTKNMSHIESLKLRYLSSKNNIGQAPFPLINYTSSSPNELVFIYFGDRSYTIRFNLVAMHLRPIAIHISQRSETNDGDAMSLFAVFLHILTRTPEEKQTIQNYRRKVGREHNVHKQEALAAKLQEIMGFDGHIAVAIRGKWGHATVYRWRMFDNSRSYSVTDGEMASLLRNGTYAELLQREEFTSAFLSKAQKEAGATVEVRVSDVIYVRDAVYEKFTWDY